MANAKATIHFKNDRSIDLDVTDVSMQPPYWMVKTTDGKRQFYSFDIVGVLTVDGEEELIQAAKAHVGNPDKLAAELGLEA